MALIAASAAVLVTAGCAGKNEPCNTDPSQIESARTELMRMSRSDSFGFCFFGLLAATLSRFSASWRSCSPWGP